MVTKLYFTIIIAILALSCDGRYRKFKSKAEVLTELNLKEAFSKEIHIIPENPVQIVTDTVLNNGFKIKIHYYSQKDSVFVGSKINNTEDETYFKNFEATINIQNGEHKKHSVTLNKASFKDFETAAFWNRAVMQFVWIDFEASNEEFVYLNTAFNIVNTSVFKDFRISINKYGIVNIQQVNTLPNTI
ncbi:hypothetical protein KFZ70_12825 [Tamlana fucoidanivorans]|uniref:Lipoprotein n=1 Tax=Allotamlana fucoidanivorans TaxID=2583814 RepID=A0A5C4SDV4_9FLAO|nr:hypothetical protein [Tamlana fucoidanivorans]TNJ41717.1 hypothetical protein FGF67_15670 [Tamlana fucoidanivorans]